MITYIKGEKRRVEFDVEAKEGMLLTVQGTPKITITNEAGTPIINNVDCTGWDQGAAQTLNVWYLFDMTSVAVGYYNAVATIDTLDQDNRPSRHIGDGCVSVEAPGCC
ncbi:MAG: hypothetical protein JWQ02_2418 [Capsulimonas sp.]|jgi:hypothetical protein|nr:hypothetical protein [Capsulimonas sp.]